VVHTDTRARFESEPRERFVQANGLTHHLVEWGSADADQVVVLCHGFLDLAWGFAKLAPRLAERGYRALAIDFRGHGESGRVPPGAYYYFPDYVLDLHELLPQLVEQPFHLLGHSMGGTVASLYAATHGGQLKSLALLEGLGPNQETATRAPARFKSWLEHVNPARLAAPGKLRDLDEAYARLAARHNQVEPAFLRLLADKSTAPHPSGEGLCWRFDPLHRTLAPIAFDAARFKACLTEIAVPTLVLQGERGFRSHDDDERIACLLHARRALIAEAGHMLHWSHDEQVAELLLAHLSGT
jgi:pimeloyl-ACP methyl ester carboxylesterase